MIEEFKTIRKIGEYEVHLPDPPDLKYIPGYNLPLSKQKFQRTEIPKNMRFLTHRAQQRIVADMFRLRKEGQWQIIKGKPIYLTGKYWYFLNFWWCEYGGLPDFRTYHADVFQLWQEAAKDKDCFGLNVIKPRRVGLTEISICEGYEHTSRVKKSWFGLQSQTEDDAYEDMKRIVDAHAMMPYFFKPINQGTDQPKKGLIFRRPAKTITEASLMEEYGLFGDSSYRIKELNSKITYEATRLKKFDGKRLSRYRMGEYGKIENKAMDTIKQWGVIRPCLTKIGGYEIIGKAWLETTVEEMEGGDSLQNSIKFWEDADPFQKDKNGRTLNGMKRLFLSAVDCAPCDEYGFPKKAEEKERLLNRFKELEKRGDFAGLMAERRKFPMTLEDALTPSADQCHFNAIFLKRRSMHIIAGADDNGNIVRKVTQGDFVRNKGIVKWQPNFTSGRWKVTQLPEHDNLRDMLRPNYYAPGNVQNFVMGVDPYDHAGEKNYGRSFGAGAIYRKYDEMVDGHKLRIDGTPNIPLYDTEQFVATYVNRPEDPEDYYNDILNAAIFYGCQIFYERDKPGVGRWIKGKGFSAYLMYQPSDVGTYAAKRSEPGASASTALINQYTELLQYHIHNYIECCHHPELINEWMKFRVEKRGKFDLAVASGFALLAARFRKYKKKEEADNQVWFRSQERKTAMV